MEKQTLDPEEILDAIRPVTDPELGYGVVDLGLVYRAEEVDGIIEVDFTLTYPGCPFGPGLLDDVNLALRARFGDRQARVSLVWNPPWEPSRMTEDLRLELGFPV